MKTLSELYDRFVIVLLNDNNNSFLVYILNQNKIKKFVLDKFNMFFNKTIEKDSVWFFKNCCYLYLFVNGKNNFMRIELKEIFDLFFASFVDNKDDESNFYGMDRLEKL